MQIIPGLTITDHEAAARYKRRAALLVHLCNEWGITTISKGFSTPVNRLHGYVIVESSTEVEPYHRLNQEPTPFPGNPELWRATNTLVVDLLLAHGNALFQPMSDCYDYHWTLVPDHDGFSVTNLSIPADTITGRRAYTFNTVPQ